MTRLLFLILLCQVFNMKKMIFLAACGILLKLMSIELVMPSNHLMLCHPLLLLPLIFPSIRVFSNESLLHIRWPKYWSFSEAWHAAVQRVAKSQTWLSDWTELNCGILDPWPGIKPILPCSGSSKSWPLDKSQDYFFKSVSP